MPLVKRGEVTEDTWLTISDEDATPETGSVIVSLQRWKREQNALMSRDEPCGVRLKSDEPAHELASDVNRLALIAIEFPTFRDGRAYSTARILRERFGFKGELRAVGNVLQDQLLFMQRCGFDALDITDPHTAENWRKAFSEFTVWYQPTGDGRKPVAVLRQSDARAEK